MRQSQLTKIDKQDYLRRMSEAKRSEFVEALCPCLLMESTTTKSSKGVWLPHDLQCIHVLDKKGVLFYVLRVQWVVMLVPHEEVRTLFIYIS